MPADRFVNLLHKYFDIAIYFSITIFFLAFSIIQREPAVFHQYFERKKYCTPFIGLFVLVVQLSMRFPFLLVNEEYYKHHPFWSEIIIIVAATIISSGLFSLHFYHANYDFETEERFAIHGKILISLHIRTFTK